MNGNARQCQLYSESLEDRALLSTFQVTNTNDSGPGSLRQAIVSANANPGLDTVRVTVQGTIGLTGQLNVAGDTNINGPGANRLTVSGGGTTRVFSIISGASVSVKGLTIANGSVTGENGGGILNAGTLTLKESVVSGNASLANSAAAGGRGGGIENTGTLTVDHSTITGNNASRDGGGLHNTGTGIAILDHATVSNNTCVADGAGIRSEVGTTLTITDSTISGNSASGFGTGGLASGGTLKLIHTTVANNNSAAAGIYLLRQGGDVLISRSTIRDNGSSAAPGSRVGGIWSSSAGRIRIEDSTITRNIGSTAGGIFGYSTFEIVRTTISDNEGTGINSSGSVTLTESTVSGNVGGIVSAGESFVINRSTISGNTIVSHGSYAAGGVVAFSGQMQITDSTISGNTVVADGMYHYHSDYADAGAAAGGLLAFAPVTIERSTVAFNQVTGAPADLGEVSGGVTIGNLKFYGYADYSGSISVRNTIIARNDANVGGPDVTGAFDSQGHNLIGVLNNNATGFVASDLRGSDAVPLNPRLGPLRNNGGYTMTHALLRGSPAINAGDNTNASLTDQRGRARIVGGTIDIGAFESGSHDHDHDDDRGSCDRRDGSHDDRNSHASTGQGNPFRHKDSALLDTVFANQHHWRDWLDRLN